MKLIIEIDTSQPIDSARLKAEAAFVMHVADNAEQFFKQAPGNPESMFVSGHRYEGAPFTPSTVTPMPTSEQAAASAASPVPTPPAPAAPPAPSAPAPAAPAGVIVDVTGLPWDARIHAGTKTQTTKKEWKKLKGVTPETVAAVTAELRQLQGHAPAPVPTPPAAPTVPPVPGVPTPPANIPVPPVPTPPVPAAPAAPAPAAPQAPAAPNDEGTLAAQIAGAVSAGKITMTDVGTQCIMNNCGNLGEAMKVPGAIAAIHAHFVSLGAIG